ncbi:GntR family transcriptional regulator [Streptomyces avicenniae]|uniref:GntR family transcriptional regulator n=1 Tax=Streptomyces avicenniae TaxID=500153 RepID=UPI0006997EC1|nr:GntR family transcriptional regulator [Streptomyces avicenniae]
MDRPLHERIADDLRRRIASGELPVGATLPSEARLCEEWAASRGPVRQALGTLRAEGLIGGGRGRSPEVRTGQVPQPFDTLLSFSRWAERIGRVPGQRIQELALRPARREVADALAVDEGETVVELLRLRLLDGRPAMVERTVFVEHVGRLLFDFDLDSGSIYAYLIERGVELALARHVFDAVPADDTDARLLGVPAGTPLLRERRRAGSLAGEPYEFSDDRYRPDQVTFTIENAQQAPPMVGRASGSVTESVLT